MFKNKKVLVTGGTGMIGRQLVDLLLEEGAIVRIASLDDPSRANKQAEFINADLTEKSTCMKVCEGMEYVFHLAGIKGSPKMTRERPAHFFVPTILMNTNVLECARKCGAEWTLYTSTVGIYAPSEVFYEDEAWSSPPSENDKFAGWAKRMGELQAEAYQIEVGESKISIVRPANVYGPYDNFDPENAMVIPSLIARAVGGENPFVVWGDGTAIRDFIHAHDVARGMIFVVKKGETRPVNLGSGRGYAIKEIVEIITKNLKNSPKIEWDTSKPSGDIRRVMDVTRATEIGFSPKISLEEGIKDTIEWYKKNKDIVNNRYNVFSVKKS